VWGVGRGEGGRFDARPTRGPVLAACDVELDSNDRDRPSSTFRWYIYILSRPFVSCTRLNDAMSS
jgi:hypothetical protein